MLWKNLAMATKMLVGRPGAGDSTVPSLTISFETDHDARRHRVLRLRDFSRLLYRLIS
jgi:hypothetical protein